MAIERSDAKVGGLQVTTLTLSHAPVNVLNLEHCRQLVTALHTVKAENQARVVVLRGAGRCFSTGVDIEQHEPKTMPTLLPTFHAIFHALLELPALTVAAVHGFCLGGAAELAFACDRVIAEKGARIGFPEIRVGCYPPVAIPLMASRIGRGRATEMILSGAEVPVDTLATWGAVDRVAEPGGLEGTLASELGLYMDKSPSVLGLAVEQLHAEARRAWGTRITPLEREYLDKVLPHPDASEGIAAFKGKRPAVWQAL